ncbi:MAG: Smr/MutS family protein [Treponema sp.]|jgi:DNA mismatch repair protein MutS2|nr:Smr/MutS family protein [Treponema sp.]
MNKSGSCMEKTLALLEFGRLIETVAAYALSAEAARRVIAERPLAGGAAEHKALVAELYGLLAGGDFPERELPEIGEILPRLAVEGAAIEADEALALALFVERGGELLGAILKEDARPPSAEKTGGSGLERIAGALPDCSACAALIFAVIDREGAVKDTPAVKKIRGRLRELKSDLDRIAARYQNGEETRRMLQSSLPSQRDGRLVLALKANFRGRVRGIVHEVSATGQTVFVEPEESVETNNQLRLEEAKLSAELRKLLRDLTAALGARREELAAFHEGIIRLETLRARARYSLETGGVFARDAAHLILKQARHPLLGKDAVPIDLDLSGGENGAGRTAEYSAARMVIITGPNTGGKTVALKTAGLFALMNQAGLAVPAAEGTALPFFSGVYTDIGDEQSIAQNLSTFSAHLRNIGNIIDEADENALVLLDELGAGTDPEEGSAIALAVLDHFIEKQSCVLVTTHHGILKNYGYSRQGVENASVEFDGRTLSPTYRIIMGLPGESCALDIALRNGLREDIVARARGYLDDERFDVSALIAGLKEKHRELDSASRAAREAGQKLREEKRRADLKELRLKQKEFLLKQEGAGEFRRFLEAGRKRLENLVREIREGEMSREKTLGVKEFLRELEEGAASMERTLDAEAAALRGAEAALEESAAGGNAGAPRGGIAAGAEVLAGPSRRRGRALRREKDGAWIVELGSVRMSFAEEDLVPAPPVKKQTVSVSADIGPVRALNEQRLIGMRAGEAVDALRSQLDAALLTGLGAFAVIHGKGDGVLQRAVHEFLESHPAVADYHFARPELGGAGRTEVILKS